jgi:hypothetical protein
VIDDLHSREVAICGTVTDNTGANKKAWQILKFKYPRMHFHGCTSHGLHLLVKDIFGATMAKRARPVADYPEGYSFEYLLMFVQDCKDDVSFFLNHHVEKAKLGNLQLAAKVVQLVQPAATRWGSLLHCRKSLKDAKQFCIKS